MARKLSVGRRLRVEILARVLLPVKPLIFSHAMSMTLCPTFTGQRGVPLSAPMPIPCAGPLACMILFLFGFVHLGGTNLGVPFRSVERVRVAARPVEKDRQEASWGRTSSARVDSRLAPRRGPE